MEEVANRILEIIKNKGISNSEMADSIGLPRPILSHILSGRNKPSLAVIQKITETYSDIDVKWLLVGEASEPSFTSPETTPLIQEVPQKTMQAEEPKINQETIRVAEQKVNPAIPSPPNTEEVNQIVHYYTDGTFKVFSPKA